MSKKKDLHHPFLSPFPKICAHRGDSAYYPENTLPAFLSAGELGADCIESDVHLTADGECVLWHDASVDRMTDGKGPISSFTLSQLKHLDAGYGYEDDQGQHPFRNTGITIPTLAEVLEALPDMRFNLDLKGTSRKLAERFVDTIYAYKARHRVLGASFHYRQLKRIRKMAPDMLTSFSVAEVRRLLLWNAGGLISICFPFAGRTLQVPECSGKIRIVTEGLIRHLHKHGISVQVWTVNEEADMRRLLAMGVDGIITDDPRLLIRVLKDPPPIG